MSGKLRSGSKLSLTLRPEPSHHQRKVCRAGRTLRAGGTGKNVCDSAFAPTRSGRCVAAGFSPTSAYPRSGETT